MKSLALLLLFVESSFSCTTLVAGRKATVDGSTLCSHSNDGGGETDPRLVFIPAATHHSSSVRPIFFSPEDYPRYVGTDRGNISSYRKEGSQSIFKPIGYIPQVASTFQYYEQTYGALNEKQLGIGESTCSCISWTPLGGNSTRPCSSDSDKDCAILSVDELSHIAMERASSARQALQLMGDLAEQYGFYGADSFEGSAESLMVIDPMEAFVFHILPHPNGHSALWVAQRVPDDSVAVVSNMFIIRQVNLSDTHNFLGSKRLSVTARQYGLGQHCPSNDQCDFTRTFSDGEYAHKYYSGRRMWGAFRLLSPNTRLNATYGNLLKDAPYPWALPVDPTNTGHKVSVELFARVHRDHYEGTEFDMTQGLAAGPFGTPNRWAGGAGEAQVKGNWERPISLFRTSDSHIVQARSWLPDAIGGTLWFGPHAAASTAYTPFPSGLAALPDSFQRGHQSKLDKSSAFWAARYVHNVANDRHSLMYPDVNATFTRLERESRRLQETWSGRWSNGDHNVAQLTKAFLDNADKMVKTYHDLFDELMFKYADGFVNLPQTGQSMGYPAWWLEAVDYADGPPPPLKDEDCVADTRGGRGVTTN